jgi:hypothetical protein
MKTFTSCADLTESRSNIYRMFRLTEFALRTLVGFRKLLVYCKSGFRKPFQKITGEVQLAGHDCVYIKGGHPQF